MEFEAGAVFCRVTIDTALFKICWRRKFDVALVILSVVPTLHLIYPYKFAPFKINAITTNSYKILDLL